MCTNIFNFPIVKHKYFCTILHCGSFLRRYKCSNIILFSKNKNIITVQSYVDSQNGFGAMIRSEFQFIIDTDTDTIQSLIFDGQEMITQ